MTETSVSIRVARAAVLPMLLCLASMDASAQQAVDPGVLRAIRSAPDTRISVVFELLDSDPLPAHEALREHTRPVDELMADVRADIRARFQAFKAELPYRGREAEVLRLYRSQDPGFMRRVNTLLAAHDLQGPSHLAVLEALDELKTQRNGIVLDVLRQRYASVQAKVAASLDRLSFAYTQDVITNTIAVEGIRAGDVAGLARSTGIAGISLDSGVVIPASDVSVPSIGAPSWHVAGFSGETADLLIPNNSGILTSHTALDHIIFENKCFKSGTCNPTNPTGNHDTLTASIVGSNDPVYGGVAPAVERIYNGIIHNFGSSQQAINWAIDGVGEDADHIGMSYGYAYGTPGDCGDDIYAKYYDGMIDVLDVNTFAGAGNEGYNPTWKGVIQPAAAYNIVAVGASLDKGTTDCSDDAYVYFSSIGPTGICGSSEVRIKPDLVAPGSLITGAASTGVNDFGSGSGTSYASPHASGSAAVLESYGGLTPLGIRALMLNSAEDRGDPGPDPYWGYGYLDMTRAFFEVDSVAEVAVRPGQPALFFSGGVAGDTVTALWNRHMVGLQGKVNNVDLLLYDEADHMLIDQSTYVGRNIEQATFPTQCAASVVVLRMQKLLTGSEELVAVSANGPLEPADPPAFGFSVSAPSTLPCFVEKLVHVTVTNTGDVAAHDVLISLALPPHVVLEGPPTRTLPRLLADETAELTFFVTALAEGPVPVLLKAESWSYGCDFVSSAESTWTATCGGSGPGPGDSWTVAPTTPVCQEDLGYAGGGTARLEVCGAPLTVAGGVATLRLTGAPANAPAWLFAGLLGGQVTVQQDVLMPVPWEGAWLLRTDAAGELCWHLTGGGGSVLEVYVQAVVPGPPTMDFSNALRLEFGQ